MLRTFAKAGTYMVKDHISGESVPNVGRIPVEEHLVMAHKFVLEWMNKRNAPTEHTVIRILARIDLHIRRRWWRNYVDNPTWSFSRAILSTEALADNQWSFDYASVLYTGQQGGNAWEPGPSWNPHAGSPKGSRKGKGKKGKGKGKGEGKGAKGAGRATMTLKIGVCTHNGQRVKCAKSKNGEWFCSFFNVQNNCRNTTGSCAQAAHKCNLLVTPTKVCNGNHAAKDHTGTTVRHTGGQS